MSPLYRNYHINSHNEQNKRVYLRARVPYRGGNSNNGSHDGAWYVNLNNDASNARWNIGAALSYPKIGISTEGQIYPHLSVEIISLRAPVSSRSNAGERIRKKDNEIIQPLFASIPHDMLKRFIARYVHDPKFMRLIGEVIDCSERGLPLGFHTSHWLANWYLKPLDTFIKQELGAVHYVRYMDDMVIFGSNKKELHKMRKKISGFLNGIGLEMKSNWQVCRFHRTANGKDKYRFLDFMGFRFYRNRTVLRKNIMLRMTRRARRFTKHRGIYSCRKMIAALGWLNQTDTYGMYIKRMKPYINFRAIKRKISRYDKRARKEKLCGTKQKAG